MSFPSPFSANSSCTFLWSSSFPTSDTPIRCRSFFARVRSLWVFKKHLNKAYRHFLFALFAEKWILLYFPRTALWTGVWNQAAVREMCLKIEPRNMKRLFGNPRRRGKDGIQNFFRNMIWGCGLGSGLVPAFWELDNEPSGSTPSHNSWRAKPSLAS